MHNLNGTQAEIWGARTYLVGKRDTARAGSSSSISACPGARPASSPLSGFLFPALFSKPSANISRIATMGIFSSGKEKTGDISSSPEPDVSEGLSSDNADQLQRHLINRQIQLIAIGGSIGTALFVSIGTGLYNAGAANLLLAYAAQSFVLAMVNNSIAEMSTAYPVSGGFIRLAGKWVDDALGFMVGWNFLSAEQSLSIAPLTYTVSTKHSSFHSRFLLSPWSHLFGVINSQRPALSPVLLLESLSAMREFQFPQTKNQVLANTKNICSAINILAVGAFGEAEFWLSGGKVILIFSLFFFTFITMVGGNPQNDVYGFRNWTNGGAFREYITTGDLGRFEGFLAGLTSAVFTVVGPEYISIVAAEAARPRIYIKAAFKMVYVRFGIFFIGGALAVGIVCNSRDPALENVVLGGSNGSAGASPYVIAMENLGIGVFPHIVNA